MKAAIYARFSTEKQSESSVEDQFRVCERLAEREGFKVVARFSDAAISGGTTQRPGYRDMLAAARRRDFDVIVAEDSSRLWRELSEQWRALKELQDLGIHVLGHGLDTRREESKILLAVSGAMAEAYRDEIARRTRRGVEGKALAGESTGGRAYGYVSARDSATGKVEIDEAHAGVVRRIFELYADGMSPRGIAARLNVDRVPSPGAAWKRSKRRSDGKWLASAIHGDVKRGTGILNNRRYTGVVAWGRSKWTRGAADSAKRTQHQLDKAAVERLDERLRIVPDELWQRVKASQARRSADLGVRVKGGLRRLVRPPKYLLSGLLRCIECEASFALSNGTRYQCSSHHEGGDAACDVSLSLLRERAERYILDCVETSLLDPKRLAEFEARYVSSRPAAVDYQRSIAELERQIQNFVKMIGAGEYSPSVGAALKAAEAELEQIKAGEPGPSARGA